jgi:ATP/maltotriose-dependent transcriptional regulator MalT
MPHMTIEQAVAAGQAALRAGRWEEARAIFQDLAGDEAPPEALAGLSDVEFWIGDIRKCIELRERAYAVCRRRGDVAGAIGSAVVICLLQASALGNLPAARGWLSRVRSLVGDQDPGPLGGWLTFLGALDTNDLSAARRIVEDALRTAREAEDSDLELCALSELGVILVQLGEIDAGLRCVDEAMAGALSREGTLFDTVVYTSCSMLTACDLLGDLERATQWCRAADEFTRSHGGPFLYAYCRVVYGRVLIMKGRWLEAEHELSRAIASTASTFPAMHVRALASLADLRLRQGRVEEAASIADSIDHPLEGAPVSAALALRRGTPTVAIALVERWLGGGREGHTTFHTAGEISAESGPAFGLLVEACLAAGDPAAAMDAATRLTSIARDQGTPLLAAHAALARGRATAALGPAGLARTCIEEAIQRFGRLEMPFETARARLALARLFAEADRDLAVTETQAAFAVFERLGAAAAADEAAAMLRSWGVAARAGSRGLGILSEREQEVLDLVAMGLSNPEIARRLFISRKTAAHHVSNLLAKLGVRNRAEAAAYAARQRDATAHPLAPR